MAENGTTITYTNSVIEMTLQYLFRYDVTINDNVVSHSGKKCTNKHCESWVAGKSNVTHSTNTNS